jgi:prepilin-type N-terminal cleavage/methylation domain-containing protein
MINTKRKRPKGMTLLELTVVILVLLTLITVLFGGARAWIRGSDKASCIINIRKVQQAVRSHQNLNGLADGFAIDIPNNLTGPGNFIETASICRAGGTYSYVTAIPALGTLVMTCSLESAQDHVPPSHAGW